MYKSVYVGFLLILLFVFQAIEAQINVELPKLTSLDATQLLNDVKILSADNMEGRLVGSSGSVKAREFISKRFKEVELKSFGDSFLQPFEFDSPRKPNEKNQGANVVGYIKGGQTPENYIVITAHYDHLGVRNGQIFNGADDNASGVAALFAMAKYFSQHQPKNSLIFVALDSEEDGLRGAKKFVQQPPVKKENILLNVNMDMIAHNDASELYVSGTRHYPYLKPYLESVAKRSPINLRLGHDQPSPPQDDWTNQSDHYVFHQLKIPFLYFGVEDHKDYHRSTDDFENINQTFYLHAVETILMVVKEVDKGLPHN